MSTTDYTDLNALAQRVHKANIQWWQHPETGERIERNKGELLMLVITELAEACEGERKDLMDDKLPHRKMAEVEMADAVIRLLDFAAGFKLILERKSLPTNTPDNKGFALFNMCGCLLAIYESGVPQGESVYVCAAIHYIEAYCLKHNYDLWGAFEEKMAYNATREDHKHEARLQAGGKKW